MFLETISNRFRNLRFQQKLTALFALTMVVILVVNLYMFVIINDMAEKVEEVYTSNVSLNELSSGLDAVQAYMEEYLNTKSSDAMKDYYRSEQEYQKLMEGLHIQATDHMLWLTEKNIYSLSKTYLKLAAEVIQAKRGRNVEKYGELYEETHMLYEGIHTYIYSLNNAQFKDNSRNYQILIHALRYMEWISVGILLLPEF